MAMHIEVMSSATYYKPEHYMVVSLQVVRSLLHFIMQVKDLPHTDISSSRSNMAYHWPPWRPRGPGTHPSPVLFQVATHIPLLVAL
jgi:hypothetical protein